MTAPVATDMTPETTPRGAALRFVGARSALGVSRRERDEVVSLGEFIANRLTCPLGSGNQESNQARKDRLQEWVTARFTRPLQKLLVQASRNAKGYALLSVFIIGGGFATSSIAVAAGTGKNSTSWIVFSVGLVVALAGGVSQLYRPGYKATQIFALAMKLREVGWDFANGTGDYKGDDIQSLFILFDGQVSEIHWRAARIMDFEPEMKSERPGTGAGTDEGPSARQKRSLWQRTLGKKAS